MFGVVVAALPIDELDADMPVPKAGVALLEPAPPPIENWNGEPDDGAAVDGGPPAPLCIGKLERNADGVEEDDDEAELAEENADTAPPFIGANENALVVGAAVTGAPAAG